MADRACLEVSMSSELSASLEAIAKSAGRPAEDLAAEAIAEFVARELETVRAIEEGRADADAGRAYSHEQVMAETRALLRGYRAEREA